MAGRKLAMVMILIMTWLTAGTYSCASSAHDQETVPPVSSAGEPSGVVSDDAMGAGSKAQANVIQQTSHKPGASEAEKINAGETLLALQAPRATEVRTAANAGNQLISAKGLASIINNDIDQARDMAIYDARRQVVETMGVQIDSETVTSMGIEVADWLQVKAGGYIAHDEVVDEGRQGDGYWVLLRAWVKNVEERKRIDRELLNRHRLLIISKGRGSQEVERLLRPLLSQNGYNYRDADYIRENVSGDTWQQLQNRRLYDLNDEVYKFMADLVVYIDSDLTTNAPSDMGGNWYDSDVCLRLFRLSGEDRGGSVIEVREDSEKILGNSLQDALRSGHPNGFRRQVAQPAVEAFMNRLSGHEIFGSSDLQLTVTITDLPSSGEYYKFKTILEHQRGVAPGSVREISQNGGTYTLSLKYRLKSIYLANLVAVNRTYEPTGHTWNSVNFRYVP